MARYQYKYRKPQPRVRISIAQVFWTLVALVLLAVPFFWATTLTVEEYTLKVHDLPDNLKNLRIVYFSDIHQGPWFSQDRVNRLISKVNGLSADVVILGGDYANDSYGAIEFFKNMPDIQARLGVYAVVGNHDRTMPESNLNLLVAEMQNKGVTALVNNVASIKLGKTYLYIAGVDDYYNGYPRVEEVAAQVSQDDFVILAGHTPDLLPEIQDARDKNGNSHWFDLALFGHTHGGQVNLLGMSPFRKLSPAVGTRYMSGWMEENRASVLVSNGVGTSHFPVRLFATPQIHLITLKKGS